MNSWLQCENFWIQCVWGAQVGAMNHSGAYGRQVGVGDNRWGAPASMDQGKVPFSGTIKSSKLEISAKSVSR